MPFFLPNLAPGFPGSAPDLGLLGSVYYKSRLSQAVPVAEANAYYAMFGVPDVVVPQDFTLHVDAITGRRRSFYELRQVVQEGATALALPVAAGGLGLSAAAGHTVGIYSHNSLVSAQRTGVILRVLKRI